MKLDDAKIGETVYTTPHSPDPGSARDVLAFVLTPVEAFLDEGVERADVLALLMSAKVEAIERWKAIAHERRRP